MTAPTVTQLGMDALGRVCADVLGFHHVYAAGVSNEVTAVSPTVVPWVDDFVEGGLPCVTLLLGEWTVSAASWERRRYLVTATIWRERTPIGETIAALYADIDKLREAFPPHARAYDHVPSLQSAVVMGGPGIESRSMPRDPEPQARWFLVAPVQIEVVFAEAVDYEAG